MHLGEGERGGVRKGHVPVDPAHHERFPGDGIELLDRGEVRAIPSGLVEPLQEDRRFIVAGGPPGGERQQLTLRARRHHILVGHREPRGGEVHMRVDEPGKDRDPGELDRTVGRRWLATAHPLHVPPIDQQPLPRRGMTEGIDARRAVEGLHGPGMMP